MLHTYFNGPVEGKGELQSELLLLLKSQTSSKLILGFVRGEKKKTFCSILPDTLKKE